MQTQRTTVEGLGITSLRYGRNAMDFVPHGTHPPSSDEKQNWLNPARSFHTDGGVGKASGNVIPFPRGQVIANEQVQKAPAQVINHVDGVIHTYNEISVKCELRVGEKTVYVELPRVLFPEKISHGLPINLEMIDEDGCRRPVIRARRISEESVAEIAGEFDAILGAL